MRCTQPIVTLKTCRVDDPAYDCYFLISKARSRSRAFHFWKPVMGMHI